MHNEDFLKRIISEQAIEIAALKEELDLLRPWAAESYRVCGKNNCNCLGAKLVKDLGEIHQAFVSKERKA